MPGKCSLKDVEVAKRATAKLISEAASTLPPGRFPSCDEQLLSAKNLYARAEAGGGSPLEQRNAYVRASFHAGQAAVCPVVASIKAEAEKFGPSRKRKTKMTLEERRATHARGRARKERLKAKFEEPSE